MDIEPIEIVALYRIWTSILYRCKRKDNKQFKNYGGRGIDICKEWEDFNVFCKDVGKRPFDGCHLDRKDNDKGYSKENCRWTTAKINHRNKRNNHYYDTHLGRICQSELIEKMGYTRKQFKRAVEKYGEIKLLEMFMHGSHPSKRIIPDIKEFIGKKIGKLLITSIIDTIYGTCYSYLCDCGKIGKTKRHTLLLKIKKGVIPMCNSCNKVGSLNPRNKITPE